MKLSKVLAAVATALVSAAGAAQAAPTMSAGQLPIDDQLFAALAAQGKTEAQIEDFVETMSHIVVYDDHKNPAANLRADRSKTKTYYSAPYLTASASRSVVGAEQFADSAMTILDAADDLMIEFHFTVKELRRLEEVLKDTIKRIADVDQALLGTLDPIKRTSLEALRATLVAERDRVTQERNDILVTGSIGAGQISVPLRHDIANAFVLQMSRLGLVPNATEQALLASNDPTQMVNGLSSMRARAASGQFGLRQVIFEAGFTAKQRSVLQTYLALRPDVVTKSLTAQSVSVRPTAQTLIDQDGTYQTREGVMQIRGVNLGNGGVCGSTSSCNVVVEYTDLGARSARFLGFGDVTPVFLPVTFEASVRVAEPDFVGSIHCDFKTGWTAQGRADVKDGAIIYDGDFSNKIKYDSIDSGFGGCEVTIVEGDKDSAFYHTLMDMDQFYRNLHTERQQASKVEKDQYRAQIEAELQWHRDHVNQRSTGGWFDDVLHHIAGGGYLSGAIGFLLGQSRDFYWHTTTLDTHNIDAINVNQSYNIHGVTATRKLAFDGFALVCYTPQASGGRLMKACPDAEFSNGDTEVQTGDDTCPETDIFGDCIEEQN